APTIVPPQAPATRPIEESATAPSPMFVARHQRSRSRRPRPAIAVKRSAEAYAGSSSCPHCTQETTQKGVEVVQPTPMAPVEPGTVAAEVVLTRPTSLTKSITISFGKETEAGDTSSGSASPMPPLSGGSGDLVRAAPDPSIWGGLTLTWMSTGETRTSSSTTPRSGSLLRSAEVADLTSWCVGLKEEGTTDRAKVCRLADKVRRMKAEADLRQEEMRQMKGNLQVVMVQWDKSRCQVAEASLHVDSLSKHLEAERSEGQALKARIG
ncbi:hypothetical protein ACJX0J_033650, partial [Zea mays]